MQEESPKILLSLIGYTPAILTETVWELVRAGQIPDEVYVFATPPMVQVAREQLFKGGASSVWAEMEDFLHRLGYLPEGRCLPKPKSVSFTGVGGRSLEDGIDTKDLDAISEIFLTRIRQLKSRKPTPQLLISITGERKSVSAQLQTAVALGADASDRMIHVDAPPAFVRNKAFFHPGQKNNIIPDPTNSGKELDADKAKISLFDIPFLPISGLMARPGALDGSFRDIVQRARECLGEFHFVSFSKKDGLIYIDGVEVTRHENCKGSMPSRGYIYLALQAVRTLHGAASLCRAPWNAKDFAKVGFRFLLDKQYTKYVSAVRNWQKNTVEADLVAEVARRRASETWKAAAEAEAQKMDRPASKEWQEKARSAAAEAQAAKNAAEAAENAAKKASRVPDIITHCKDDAKNHLLQIFSPEELEKIFIFRGKTPRFADNVRIEVVP